MLGPDISEMGKYLPKMIMVCDWLSKMNVIIVCESQCDSFFRKTIAIVLLSSIFIINQSQNMFIII